MLHFHAFARCVDGSILSDWPRIREKKKNSLPKPVTFGDASVTANCIVLICHPYEDNDIEGSGTIVEELSHNSFHS